MGMVERKIIVCVLVHDNNEGLIFMKKIPLQRINFKELVEALPMFFPFVKSHTRVRS